MWVASPSAVDTDIMMNVYSYGYVSNYNYDLTHGGFRPLVSLKSSVQIEKIEEGRYQIIGTSGGSGNTGGSTESSGIGKAGINKEATKYVWRRASEGEPTKEQITESLPTEGTTETLDGEKIIQLQTTLTKKSVDSGNYKLWFYVDNHMNLQ